MMKGGGERNEALTQASIASVNADTVSDTVTTNKYNLLLHGILPKRTILRFLGLFLLLLDCGLLHHRVGVALAMIFQHLDEDVRRLEEIAQKGFGKTSFVVFLEQHHEQIPIFHHVKQVVLQDGAGEDGTVR